MQLISEIESSDRSDFRISVICFDLMSTVKVFKTMRIIDVSLNLVGFNTYG